MGTKTTIKCGKEQAKKIALMKYTFNKKTIEELLEEMINIYLKKKGYDANNFIVKKDKRVKNE